MDRAWYWNILACPDCRQGLRTAESNVLCDNCGFSVSTAIAGPVDLRPRTAPKATLQLPRTFEAESRAEELRLDTPRAVYGGPRARRDSSELFSALIEAGFGPGDLLDLGCGPKDQKPAAESLGYRYVGIDLFDRAADLSADAHALPFQDETLDVVLSYAVLEHLHNPFVALAEIRRVLKPRGVFLGTVSQGEPFHGSFFHHTLWGLVAVIEASGLSTLRAWPSRDTIGALADMSGYPRVVRWALRLVALSHRSLPFLSPRKWLHASPREKQLDLCHRAGSLGFLAQRSD